MNASQIIYYDKNLYNLIMTFNSCSRCKSYFMKEDNIVNKHFYMAYSRKSYKWYKKICYDCLKLQIYGKI
jgi:hypothetical protein